VYGDNEVTEALASEDLQAQLRDARWVLTLQSGSAVGFVLPLEEGETVLGRAPDTHLQVHDESLSRAHAAFVLSKGVLSVRDLGSTNGTYVDGNRVTGEYPLKGNERIWLGSGTLVRLQRMGPAELAAAQVLWESATADPLTGLNNRRYLEQRIRTEYAFAKRHQRPLSMLVLDIDNFKHVNDTWGHIAGDAVLRAVGACLTSTLRAEDVAARFGGEEFVLLLRDEDAARTQIAAERIRAQIEHMRVPWEGRSISVTVSIGLATFTPDSNFADGDAILASADACLFRAKQSGRNCVVANVARS
jgi:diguanylate cyclase (GGDEF)-like protein